MELTKKLFKGDRSVWIIFMLLCLVSVVEGFSATSTLAYKQTYFWEPIARHITFLLCGGGAVLLLLNTPSRYFQAAIALVPIAIGLLILTMFIGEETNETQRFLSLFGVKFQPSEVAKLAGIIFVAFMLSKQERLPGGVFWFTIGVVGLICGLILPDNFSTSFLLFTVCFLMMFVGQTPLKKLGLIIVAGLLLVVMVYTTYHFLPDTAKKVFPDRLTTWVERFKDFGKDNGEAKFVINDDNRQVNYAKIAIARGGLFGRVPGRSVQRDFLPHAFDDFIYAIIIEELGLILGGFGVLMLYVFLMFRVAIIARKCEKLFPKYLALGCGLLIVIQALINMAVAVNLIPVTGQPLPLISRGGTSIIITCCYFGIILSVSRFSAGIDDENEEEEDDETASEVENNNEPEIATTKEIN